MMKRVKSKIAIFVLLCFLFFQPAYSRAQSYSVTSATLDYFDNAKSALSGYLSGFPDAVEGLSATVRHSVSNVIFDASSQAAASAAGLSAKAADFFGAAKNAVFSAPRAIKEFVFSPSSNLASPQNKEEQVFQPPISVSQNQETPPPEEIPNNLREKIANLNDELNKIKQSGLVISAPMIQEKVIEKTILGVSEQELSAKLAPLEASLLTGIAELNGRIDASNRAIALTNRINNISGATINNSTFTGTVHGLSLDYLSLTGGTLTGSLTGTSATFSGQLTVSGPATSTIAGDTNFDSGTLYVDSLNNRVGVGTTSPTDTLSLNGNFYLAPVSAPATTAGRLYNVSSDLYWAGNLVGSASVGNWTLSSGNVYRSSGSVGIGTTSPSTKLSVGGAAGDTTGHGYFTGGLGVGMLNTTAGTLNVLGQCVTGDTKLKRRRRRKIKSQISNLKSKKTDNDDDYIYDEVAIKDIQAGDEILSLNEETGRIVWSKVNALMDMGVKPIYKIATASGKAIRATGNHPYLVKEIAKRQIKHQSPIKEAGWIAAENIKEGDYIAVSKPKVGVFIDDANMFYAQKKAGWRVDYNKLKAFLGQVFEVKFMNYYLTVPNVQDSAYLKTQKYLEELEERYGGSLTIKSKPLKYIFDGKEKKRIKKGNVDGMIAVDLLSYFDELDTVVVLSGDSDYLDLIPPLLKKGKKVLFMGFEDNMAWELRQRQHIYFDKIQNLMDSKNKNAPEFETGVPLLLPVYSSKNSLSSPLIVDKEKEFVWARVNSIENLPDEQVFDIEIEGTRNFIGNDIVAHNTYIGGSVGIGTTSPYAKLSVEGSSALGNSALAGYFTATTTTATSTFAGGLAVETSGLVYDYSTNRVGIGTSSPNQQLEITGNFRLPVSTATAGIIYSGADRFIHNFGTNNFFAGVNAGNLTMTGSSNVGIGANSLDALTTGADNIAVGQDALTSVTSSYGNVGLGSGAARSVANGIRNTAVGSTALYYNDSGSDNTAIGSNALKLHRGSGNTAVGSSAGEGSGTGYTDPFTNTTVLGYMAGYLLADGSDNNILLGYQSGNNITTGSNNLILGYDIDAPSNTASNQMSIGNLIYSAGVNGIGTGFSTGNIGVSSSTPWAKLSVHGLATDSDTSKPLFLVASSTASATTTHFIITNTGNVGVGTAAPAYPLDVLGTGTGAIIARFNDVNSTGCTLATGGTISCSSDISLKKNIEDIGDGLNKVLGLHPVLFNWKSEDNSSSTLKNLGFIAQEVELILPKLVSSEDGGTKQLNTIGMIPVLTKAIQELNLKVEDLKASNSQFSISNFQSISNDPISNDNIISQLFNQFLEQLKNIGIVISDGVITAREFVADKITAKKVVTEAFEMKDSVTGDTYCVRISEGEWNKFRGTCGEVSPSTPSVSAAADQALGVDVDETSDSPPAGQNDENEVASTTPDTTTTPAETIPPQEETATEAPEPPPAAEPEPATEPEV